jgi:hypothetical protein
MAYSVANPPALVSSLLGTTKGKVWSYDSTDAATVVRADAYISNGFYLGMSIGDIVDHIDSVGGTVAHRYVVKSVAAGGAADLTDGTALTVTDTD